MTMTMQGDELKALRAGLGMTQAQFAEVLGMSRKAINEMEVGRAVIERRTELAARYIALQQPEVSTRQIATVWREGDTPDADQLASATSISPI